MEDVTALCASCARFDGARGSGAGTQTSHTCVTMAAEHPLGWHVVATNGCANFMRWIGSNDRRPESALRHFSKVEWQSADAKQKQSDACACVLGARTLR